LLDVPVRRSITKGFIHKNDNRVREERERRKEGGRRGRGGRDVG
jgi:hypothetical protein